MKNYTFLGHSEYLQSLTSAVSAAKPGTTISLATMLIDTEQEPVSSLMLALYKAAKRGCHVYLIIDANTFRTDKLGAPGAIVYRYSLGEKIRLERTQDLLEQLAAAGGHYYLINKPGRRLSLPQAGRSHIKASVVGDHIFLGGCNLLPEPQIDIMVTWHDHTTAQQLHGLIARIAEYGSTRGALSEVDIAIPCGNTMRLLVDAGVRDQSIIYEEALDLIDSAKEWLFITCQYFPGGQTVHHLAAAHKRGVKIEINYSHPRAHGTGAPLQYAQQLAQHVRQLPEDFFEGRLDKFAPNLHAKVLASEQAAMVGSHNYVEQGVHLGTAEICLYVRNGVFAKDICGYMRRQLVSIRLTEPTETIN